MDRRISNRIFILLIAVYALAASISVFLPQTSLGLPTPTDQLPASLPVLALVSAGVALILYGGLGFIGLVLSRKLSLPEIWDLAVTNRQRFLIPAMVGLGVGVVIIIGDLILEGA